MHLFQWWDKAAEIKTSAQYNVIAEMAILAASQNLWLMERIGANFEPSFV